MQEIILKLPEKLLRDIDYIKFELAEINRKFKPKEELVYLTRIEVAKMLQCSIGSVHNLSSKKVLTKYQIGGKVLYRKDQVEQAIVKLK